MVRKALSTWFLILDDDPTGTQGITGVPVVIQPSTGAFRWAADHGSCVYALTNTRAMAPELAGSTVAAFIDAAKTVATKIGRDLVIVNRSDSTLRGHFPVEIQQLTTMADPADYYRGCLLVPAFPEAGRLTIDGIHLVRKDDQMVPVAETEYATDSTFGFTESRLTDWARSRVPGAWHVVHLTSETIDGGPEAVIEFLGRQIQFTVVCPSVRSDADLAVLAAAQRQLRTAGVHYLVQAGPAYPRHLAEVAATGTVALQVPSPGIIVVGSHTGLTTRQLRHAQARFDLSTIEIDVTLLLSESANQEIDRCVDLACASLQGQSVVLVTSRLRRSGSSEALSLQIANRVGDAVAEITRRIALVRPGFIVSKGGITSRDVAAISLGWDAAMVEGPLIDQTLPVWSTAGSNDGVNPQPLIVFPGNVGEDDLLSRALEKLNVDRIETRSTRHDG